MKDERLKPCPFCGEAPSVFICDSEGNIHDEDYLTKPYWIIFCFKARNKRRAT